MSIAHKKHLAKHEKEVQNPVQTGSKPAQTGSKPAQTGPKEDFARFPCPICDEQFRRKDFLESHIKTCRDNSESLWSSSDNADSEDLMSDIADSDDLSDTDYEFVHSGDDDEQDMTEEHVLTKPTVNHVPSDPNT